MKDTSASQQIDDIIQTYSGWKGQTLSQLRAIITQATPEIIEEVKWKMPSRPEGLPVWSCNGIVCIAETFKNDIKLVFFKGAQLPDPHQLFNARLKSKTDRAIMFQESDSINESALKELVIEAVQFSKTTSR